MQKLIMALVGVMLWSMPALGTTLVGTQTLTIGDPLYDPMDFADFDFSFSGLGPGNYSIAATATAPFEAFEFQQLYRIQFYYYHDDDPQTVDTVDEEDRFQAASAITYRTQSDTSFTGTFSLAPVYQIRFYPDGRTEYAQYDFQQPFPLNNDLTLHVFGDRDDIGGTITVSIFEGTPEPQFWIMVVAGISTLGLWLRLASTQFRLPGAKK